MDEELVFECILDQTQEMHPPRLTHRRTTSKSRKATLERLPVELLIQILSHVPARDLRNVYQASKTMKDCIDENNATILRPSMIRNRKRISAQYDHVVNVRGVEFNEAVQRYYQYYGPDRDALIYSKDGSLRFISNWVVMNYSDIPEGVVHEISYRLAAFVEGIVEQHYDPNISPSWMSIIMDSLLKHFADHGYYQDYPQHLQEVINRLEFVDRSAELDIEQQHIMPRYFIKADSGEPLGYSLLPRTKNGGTHEDVGTCLGLPNLSETTKFEYRVRVKEAWWIVQEKLRNGGGGLTLSMQAAALEEIFIW